MAKLLLIFGVVLVMTVTRSDGTVTLPLKVGTFSQGRDYTIECVVVGEDFIGWETPSKAARPECPGKPATQSETITPTSPSGNKKVTRVGNIYTLVVTKVSPDDGGLFECVGSQNSKTFTFKVRISTAVDDLQYLKEGDKETIVLKGGAYPEPTYTWTKDGQPVVFDSRRTLDLCTGSIILNPVRLSDAGNYTCRVTNTPSGFPHTYPAINVQVTVPPMINKVVEPVERRLTQGNNVTFHCDITAGSPKPIITWYYEWNTDVEVDKNYDPRFSHPTEEKWTITGIETKDKRKYMCIAENRAGRDELRFEILQVFVPPTIDHINDVLVDEGANPTLQCKVSGSPAPMVRWYKDNNLYREQLTSTEGNKIVQTIMFTNINWLDSGKYTCKANNGAKDGEGDELVVEQSISIHVNSPPRLISSRNPVYSFVGYRENVTVLCAFSGYPAPEVKMVSENGTEVASGNSSASFTIQDTTEDVFGKYNCSAVNSNGREDITIMLSKAVAPGPPRQVFAETTCKAVTLKWEDPAFNGGLDITNYVIRVHDENGAQLHVQTVSGRLHEADINYRNFEAETMYTVYLIAQSAVGFGTAEMITSTTKQYCVPGKPQITNTDTNIDSTFTLTWLKPTYDGGDNIIKYKVEWRRKPITNTTVADEKDNIGDTQLKVEGLEAGQTYEFKVYARNRAEGISEPDTMSFTVKTGGISTGSPGPIGPEVEARTDSRLGSGAIAGIVIAVILIVLITIDLFCCFFNSCGIIFCCHQALCGGGGTKKSDYADGKATEMEKKPLPENV